MTPLPGLRRGDALEKEKANVNEDLAPSPLGEKCWQSRLQGSDRGDVNLNLHQAKLEAMCEMKIILQKEEEFSGRIGSTCCWLGVIMAHGQLTGAPKYWRFELMLQALVMKI
ncbi:Hypothetical protein NTJ_07614 [Nesidiocoris tenuis]|uniref:Uncharacterized protein n=1 Tax=Nesidiocoris tenuis TaxID=355587 RepID=A0ABN7ATJ4_9HEMI|nr:Hypothetical protein NTJ_07614 [Nesidiocoris tenuis]